MCLKWKREKIFVSAVCSVSTCGAGGSISICLMRTQACTVQCACACASRILYFNRYLWISRCCNSTHQRNVCTCTTPDRHGCYIFSISYSLMPKFPCYFHLQFFFFRFFILLFHFCCCCFILLKSCSWVRILHGTIFAQLAQCLFILCIQLNVLSCEENTN